MPISYSAPVIRNPYAWPDGTAALPGVFFANDPDTSFYRIGSGNVGLTLDGVKAWDFAATLTQFTGANSTSNTRLLIENTSNAAAASHAIVDVAVGGITSTGDPQLRLTIPSGTSWYVGVDNTDGDSLVIGTGTTVGTSSFLTMDARTSGIVVSNVYNFTPPAITVDNGATAGVIGFVIRTATITYAGTTQVTTDRHWFESRGPTLAQSGGALTIDRVGSVVSTPSITGLSVTLTNSVGVLVLNPAANSGTNTNLIGLYCDGLTRGTNNYQLLFKNGSTEPTTAPADHAGIYCVDVGTATVLGFVAETAVVSVADFVMTTKIIVRYNGVSYALAATTVLT